MRYILAAALAASVGLASGTSAADKQADPPPAEIADENAVELERLAGSFERFYTNKAGVKFRELRELAGNRSTVALYDDVGNLVQSHTSTVKVEKKGPVRVFTFFNVLVTAGPNKGHVHAAPSSYIYRLEGDYFFESWGLLEGDTRPPQLFVWKRVK